MQRDELLATIEQLHDIAVDTLDRDELATIVAATARVRSWLDALELRCARQGRTLADTGRCEPAPALIARHTGRSSRDAEQITRRDRVAEAMPTFEHGLTNGAVTAGHLDAIANATRHAPPEVRAAFALHEDELLSFATGDTIEVFTRRCRSLVTELTTDHTGNDAADYLRQRDAATIRTWVDHADGMHHTHAALDPLRHEIFWTALNRAIRRRQQLDGNARTPWNQLQVDALIDAVTGRTTNHPPPTVAPGARPARNGSHGAEPGTQPAAGARPHPPDADRPPSPAADIARDLAAAVDRTIGTTLLDDVALLDDVTLLDDVALLDDVDVDTGPDPGHPDIDPDIDIDDIDDSDIDSTSGAAGPLETDQAIEAELRRIEQRVPEISVLTDISVLIDGLHACGLHETEDGIVLPVSTIRRLCCDAEIIPTVLDGNGVPLDVGRSKRTINRAQRRALRAMHRTCINPDCNVPFSQTKAHHIRWWVRDNGPTDISNLAPLCERCHHLVHEGGWTLTMTPDRIATWTRPDGTIHHTGPTIDRPPPGPRRPSPGRRRGADAPSINLESRSRLAASQPRKRPE